MVYTLDITPQTHVRSTQGDAIYFRIPEYKLRPEGLKRKLRLQRYNAYKQDLKVLGLKDRITDVLSDGAFKLRFYIPAPLYYRPVKGKEAFRRKELEGKKHTRKPDWDNLSKAFCDALFPDDSFIWDVRVQKFWTLKEKGWIEIEVK